MKVMFSPILGQIESHSIYLEGAVGNAVGNPAHSSSEIGVVIDNVIINIVKTWDQF